MLQNRILIRAALPGEAPALTALCLRAKAHWSYDRAFMAAVAPMMRIGEPEIRSGRVLVAARDAGALGVAAIARMRSPGTFDLSHLFVLPESFGRGIGRALFGAAAALAKSRGATRLVILADPNAAGFYEKLGARPCGQAPSDAAPGRMLPLFEFDLAPRRSGG
jgi:GNAT superfamily N-acetyltransferase